MRSKDAITNTQWSSQDSIHRKKPSTTTLVVELKKCGKTNDLQRGKILHTNAVESGCHRNIYVATTLISMYSKCGCMQDARDVFDSMLHRNTVSWNALILGYVENGQSSAALDAFQNMDYAPDRVTFIASFKAFAALAEKEVCLQKGVFVHIHARELGFERDIVVASTLVDMYSKCGCMPQARAVFDGMLQRDVVSWNTLILGYVENGQSLIALEVFNSMDCVPDAVTFVAALKACATLACLEKGASVHKQARELGLDRDVYVANTLVDMYRKCGHMLHASSVFNGMMYRDVVSWNVLMLGYVENGQNSLALDVFHCMDCAPNSVSFIAALKACAGLVTSNKLDKGVFIHRQARELGFEKDVVVANTLVDMYGKCGSMLYARTVFDGIVHRDVVSWNVLMLGYVENGLCSTALDVFKNMDCLPDRVTFVAALKACAGLANEFEKEVCLQNGVYVHMQAREFGFEKDVVVANTLVSMYGKCGDMLHARDVFNGMMHRNVVSYTALIAGYVENGQSSTALEVFQSMECAPDAVTLTAALKACAEDVLLQKGQAIHVLARALGFEKDVLVASSLVEMYRRCGDMRNARAVFDGMTQRDAVTWTALILGYVENGENAMALEVFQTMDCVPNRVTLVAALRAACARGDNKEVSVQSVHRQASALGLEKDLVVANRLVDIYSKCRDMVRARAVFEGMMERDVVSWTALIDGYVENGQSLLAFEVFNSMDCTPDVVTFVAVLKACAGLATKEICLSVHRELRELGFEKEVVVANTLMDMYGKCGDMMCAQGVFDGIIHRSVISWNVLILAYVENGDNSVALDVFNSMDCAPDTLTYVAALKACAGSKERCMSIHRRADELGFVKDIFVANTLVDVYSKCGEMLHAQGVFDAMSHRSVVSWNALIDGYVENGQSSVGIEVFNSMDCLPDRVTFVVVLKACASLGALELGQRVHERVCELGLEQDRTVGNSLVDLYGKCGNMSSAEDVFNRMRSRTTVSWNALIGGYSVRGDTHKVLSVIRRMEELGIQMDSVTMLLILTSCNHAGMVREGVWYFQNMRKYGIISTTEHYTCMVDMLGRANRLEEALLLVRVMPFVRNSVVWTALLAACRKWSNVEIGEVAFNALVALNEDEQSVAAAYVLMRNMYERLGMQPYTLLYVCVPVRACVRTMHTYIHTYIYIYMCVCVCVCVCTYYNGVYISWKDHYI